MKVKTKKVFKCGICDEEYETKQEAAGCESRLISQDKGVKVGDIVLITHGDGSRKKAKVTRLIILDKYWGHHAWTRYWHTVALSADIIGDWGSRLLTFDSYEVIKKN